LSTLRGNVRGKSKYLKRIVERCCDIEKILKKDFGKRFSDIEKILGHEKNFRKGKRAWI